jgi:signal transduction histidine kinase
VSARELAQFTSSPSRPVTARVFDDGDGLPGPASQSHSLPSLVKGTDGRLWVQGGLAVSWLDPHDAGTRPEPSPPIILGMAVAGHPFDTSAAALTLPRDERSPVISYTAPATTNASRVRFQTRLTGFDDDWVDQAGRREVSYPHLAAGRYVFSVRASTDGVIWTKRPPQLVFSVQTFFYETWWFKACCVLLALLAVWMLAKWEAWRALRRYHAREKIRAEEREAVARDIHDTLLQSNVALILQLESISQTAPEGETRRRISALADSASEAVTEGREKVTALRERIAEGGSVDMRLKTLGGRLAQQSDARFRLSVVGEPRALRPVPADELYLLISEAVTNAFWHARATTVEVELNYGLRWLRVSVVDDGIGIAPSALRPEGRTGHWGISGMYERAGQLRAQLAIGRRQPKGTDVRLDVPAKRIYVEQGAWRFMALG